MFLGFWEWMRVFIRPSRFASRKLVTQRGVCSTYRDGSRQCQGIYNILLSMHTSWMITSIWVWFQWPPGSPFSKSCHYLWHKIFVRTAKKNALPTKVKCKSCRMQGKGLIFISTCIKRHYIRNSLVSLVQLTPFGIDFHWVATGSLVVAEQLDLVLGPEEWHLQCNACRRPELQWGTRHLVGVGSMESIGGPKARNRWGKLDSCTTIHNWVLVSNIFYFPPYLGKIPILINIFQRGWNHQLDNLVLLFMGGISLSL